ncbi:response regulator receiver domain [Sphingobacterium cavernae]|uniref:response regulator receiver domain n=1 Tax=Sphingobacterium cavernae TaxID=2592657 RepID=UPI00122FC102|nr:response regulator receiver domain [Sphingobacterium cavernae]
MTFSEKTLEIVKESIKSAVFIDEKARNVYDYEGIDDTSLEQKLSVSVYENFKKNGISLAVHKFQKDDLDNVPLLNYLFNGRDLVLLDWKLEGEGGEEYSLELLSKVVDLNHINFCCIYTTEPSIDNIFLNILSYFSGIDSQMFLSIKDKFIDNHGERIEEVKREYNFLDYNHKSNGRLIAKLVENDFNFNDLINLCGGGIDWKEALFLLMLAFEDYHKSTKSNHKPTLISIENKSLVINNTILCILNKENALKEEPIEIISKLSEKIENSQNSFSQLLGLEMQNVFNRDGSFIDSNLLKISKEALFAHRKFVLENNNNDIPFKTLIKKVLLEHAYLKLRTARLSLLNDDFLQNQVSETLSLTDEQVALINTFYNSVSIKSLHTDSSPMLNFGDVFKDEQNDYYLCITALCDCLRPEKIQQNYYFVKGKKLDVKIANTLGDSAFISYVGEDEAITWVALEPDQNIEIENEGKTEEQIELETLRFKTKYFAKFKHLPVYIKPHIYNVKNPRIIDDKLEIRRVESVKLEDGKINGVNQSENSTILFNNITYLTTLRSDYAQRIANHAFSHPVRVGVDFVKI